MRSELPTSNSRSDASARQPWLLKQFSASTGIVWWLLVLIVLGLHFAPALHDGWRVSAEPHSEFIAPRSDSSRETSTPALCREEFIDPLFTTRSVHVSSLCELPGGRLAAVWYGGTREGARDVAVYFATREPAARSGWSEPRVLVSPASAARETFRFVRKVGNPLLFSGANGDLELLYVSIGIGGWSGSSLNYKRSSDQGQTWSQSQRLGLSPFFNLSELVKNGPSPLAGGGWVVPIYHETIGKFPELLWLRAGSGRAEAVKSRPFGGRDAFQPALAVLDRRRALLLCRAPGKVRRIFAARTEDAGRHWSEPEPTSLPNLDSGLDLLRLNDGALLLAFNDSGKGRENLRLAVSRDDGVTWRRAATLAEEPGAEFSYPFLLQTSDGLVHLTYTWKRRGIKHVTFNLAWLDAQPGGMPR